MKVEELSEVIKIRKRLQEIESGSSPNLKGIGNHYIKDVSFLLKEIEQLEELLKDRDEDLNFEYNERIAAEKEVERLKEKYGDW